MASLELFVRLLVSLVVIGGIILLLRRFIDRAPIGPGGGARIEVLARRALGRQSSLLLVQCGGRTMLLGADNDRTTLLAEGPDLALAPDEVTLDLAQLSTVRRPAAAALGPGATDDIISVDEILGDLDAGSEPAATGSDGDPVEALLALSTTGARTRQSGPRSAPARMSVIQALREATVRKG
ncbi:MAG: FliO/MopB family protein [Acidimicrobiales bacterium]